MEKNLLGICKLFDGLLKNDTLEANKEIFEANKEILKMKQIVGEELTGDISLTEEIQNLKEKMFHAQCRSMSYNPSLYMHRWKGARRRRTCSLLPLQCSTLLHQSIIAPTGVQSMYRCRPAPPVWTGPRRCYPLRQIVPESDSGKNYL